MSAPQNTIAIVYDYDQTLSPSYMQDETVFPAFGINSENFWRRCSDLVRDDGYDNELAYMKVLLDTERQQVSALQNSWEVISLCLTRQASLWR